MEHTRVFFWVKPTGEKKYSTEHVFLGVKLQTVGEAEDYMEYGHPGNYVIEDAVSESRHGSLENWKVKKVMVLKESELAFLPTLRQMENDLVRARREAREVKKETKKLREKMSLVDANIKDQLKRLGWEELTQDELEWVMSQYNNAKYFRKYDVRPSAHQIKVDYEKELREKNPSIPDRFVGNEELRHTNGWLDPYGVYHRVSGFAEHNRWADDWLRHNDEIGYLSIEPGEYAYDVLEKKGWIRVMDWGAGTQINFGYKREPNHAQKEVLYLFCALHKIKNPF